MFETATRTRENSISIESDLGRLIGRIRTVQDFYKTQGVVTVLVGSLGRMISVEDNNIAFTNPLSGRIRDIDLMCIRCPQAERKTILFQEAKNLASPFTLEEHFDGKVELKDQDTIIRYKDIALPVNQRIFNVKRVSLCGFSIDTLDPSTLFHLTALYGPMKPKDFLELIRFGRQVRKYSDVLPEALFNSFHDLARKIEKRYPNDILIGKLRWLYHRKVNYDKRVALSRIVIPVRRMAEPLCGWIESPHS